MTEGISISEARRLGAVESPPEIEALVYRANELRKEVHGNRIDLCSIINARSGKCSEDCAFCAQSARYPTDGPSYPLKDISEIIPSAKAAQAAGAQEFCIVTSGRSLSEKDFSLTLTAIERIKAETGLKCGASLGILDRERAMALKEAGLDRYNHNLETARSHFSHICTTHSYEERLRTIEAVKGARIETCVGGILNLGETDVQRIEFAYELKALEPTSVPMNFLNPRPGTALGHRPLMNPWETAKWLAIFRLIMPEPIIRLCGGRVENLGPLQSLGIMAGVNGLLIGNYLTTVGPAPREDFRMLRGLGFQVPWTSSEKS